MQNNSGPRNPQRPEHTRRALHSWRTKAIKRYHELCLTEIEKLASSLITYRWCRDYFDLKDPGDRRQHVLAVHKKLCAQIYSILKPPGPRGRPRKLSERDAQILSMREKNLSWSEIGKKLGISKNSAQQAHAREERRRAIDEVLEE